MKRYFYPLLLVVAIVAAYYTHAYAVELTAATNKELFAEFCTRLHGSTVTQAQVDSFLVAYGHHAGLKDAQGNPRAATVAEFGADTYSRWVSIWRKYRESKRAAATNADFP